MQHSNNEQKEDYSLMCPKYNKRTNVSIIFRLSKQCKTDIQLTKSVSGIKSDLWNSEGCFCPECESKVLKELIK